MPGMFLLWATIYKSQVYTYNFLLPILLVLFNVIQQDNGYNCGIQEKIASNGILQLFKQLRIKNYTFSKSDYQSGSSSSDNDTEILFPVLPPPHRKLESADNATLAKKNINSQLKCYLHSHVWCNVNIIVESIIQ